MASGGDPDRRWTYAQPPETEADSVWRLAYLTDHRQTDTLSFPLMLGPRTRHVPTEAQQTHPRRGRWSGPRRATDRPGPLAETTGMHHRILWRAPFVLLHKIAQKGRTNLDWQLQRHLGQWTEELVAHAKRKRQQEAQAIDVAGGRSSRLVPFLRTVDL